MLPEATDPREICTLKLLLMEERHLLKEAIASTRGKSTGLIEPAGQCVLTSEP